MFDFYRVAACVPQVKVGDTDYNTDRILEKITEAYDYKASIIAVPELAVSGYSCQDLFFQEPLMKGVKSSLGRIIKSTKDRNEIIIIGAPFILCGKLYNTAFVILKGKVLGISVKTFIPNHNEFYEKRWFNSANSLSISTICFSELGIDTGLNIPDYELPVGNDIIYDIDGCLKFGVEICEDLWAPVSPSNMMALGGAELIVNI